MAQKADIRLDILVKKEADHYEAHCLQFDLVATDDSIEGVKRAINELCIAHVEFALEHDNLEYLFSLAPPAVWLEYLLKSADATCEVTSQALASSPSRTIPAFMIQEIVCHA